MRGTAAGEGVVSQAQTKEWDEGYERTFGERRPQRGRWVWDRAQGKLVPEGEYQPEPAAINAPIMVDRFMEGHSAQDGTDIGSRAKRNEFMRRNGLTDATDYSSRYCAARKEAKDRAVTERTRNTVVELAKTDTRNLRSAVDHLRGKR